MEARRFDSVPLRARQTPEGFLRDSPVLARSGVQEYRRSDGTVQREYRPPGVVFHADVLAMVRGLPIIEDHAALITSANSRQHVIGTVLSEGRADAATMSADIIIHDPTPVSKGKKELSLAYHVRLDETPGTTPEGEPYDVSVTAITRMDHLAVVPKGRAGVARLNLDASDAVSTTEEEGGMPDNLVAVRLDGIAYQVPPEVERAVTKAQADLAAATTRADTAEAERDAEKARADAATASVAQARTDAAAEARARIGLEAQAKAAGVAFAADATDRAIREAGIKHLRKDAVDLSKESDAYVAAAFDIAIRDAVRADGNAAGQMAEAKPLLRADAAPGPLTAAAARDLMIARTATLAR